MTETIIQGNLKSKELTEGKKKNGDIWKRLGIRIDVGNGREKTFSMFNTHESFDIVMNEIIKGDAVRIGYTTEEKEGKTYNNLVSISKIDGDFKPAEEVISDDTGNGKDAYWEEKGKQAHFGNCLKQAVTIAIAKNLKDSDELFFNSVINISKGLYKATNKAILDLKEEGEW